MAQNAAFIDCAFASSNAFQDGDAIAEVLEGFDVHKISGGFAMLSNEHRVTILLKIVEDFGGMPLKGGNKLSFHLK